TGDGVAIATRDFGGDGSPIVFIHGAGANLVDAAVIAPYLTEQHRLVAMDLRGHGRSGDGPWTWEGVLNDVRAVIRHYRLADVAVLGHSLGGMIAAMLTATGEVAAGINGDGHGPGTRDLYDGISDDEYTAGRKIMTDLMEKPPKPLPRWKVALVKPVVRRQMRKSGFTNEQATDRLARMLGTDAGGATVVRPAPPWRGQLLDAIDALDLVDLYRRTRRPLLIYNATNVATRPRQIRRLAPFLRAYRAGLRRTLRGLAAAHPLVSYQEIDASHNLHIEQPRLVAEQVTAFLANLTG